MMNLENFLLWLVAGGSVVAVSWIMEQVAWFQNLSSKQRQWLQYVCASGLGIVALAVQTYVPSETLKVMAPYFGVIAGTFGMVFLNQIAHTLDPRKK